jgi:hypothetical protein
LVEDLVDRGMVLQRDKTRLLVVRAVEVLAIAQEPTLLEDRETLDKVLQEETVGPQRPTAAVVVVVLGVLDKLGRPPVLVMGVSE